jgi:AcrR family transcriptional regulator
MAASEVRTRDRIITEAIRLFADRGFKGTTVGDIEQAAGLAPRAGGLYKHFSSKEEVFEAAIELHVREIETVRSEFEFVALGDPRVELEVIGRWALAELGAEQPLVKIVMKDGDQFPHLMRMFKERIVDRGTEAAVEVMERVLGEARMELENVPAIATIALGSLVNYRVEQTIFGVPPGGLDEDEFIQAWVEVWTMVALGATTANASEVVTNE